MGRVINIKEHQPLKLRDLLGKDVDSLEEAVGNLFKRRNGKLIASNYVGIITTRSNLIVEILPKIDLGGDSEPDDEKTKVLFLEMLRCWRRIAKTLSESDIRAMRKFPMLEIFVHQFLVHLNVLARNGLAKRYIPMEENLPYVRGRLLFRENIRENLVNLARFYVAHNELSVNRPANRLIQSVLTRLTHEVQLNESRQLLRQLTTVFENVPQSTNLRADWQTHHVDRSMRHYQPVMQWAGLFLFNQGLTTYSGRYSNLSLLFPMEQVFEDFVTDSFRRFQNKYIVTAQHPQEKLTTINGVHAFTMKPDIFLTDRKHKFILDAKWKEITTKSDDHKHGIDQADMYQLYAYGKCYHCDVVALIYPKTRFFRTELHYKFFDGLKLICLPFDVSKPEASVDQSIQTLQACLPTE